MRTWTILLIALLPAAANAASDKPQKPRVELLEELARCRNIADPAQQLDCYRNGSDALLEAERRGDLVVLNKKGLQETRRSLFGFVLPHFNIGGIKMDEPDVDRIDTVVASAHPTGYYWSITLANDAGTWETTEPLNRDPRSGDKIRIKKGFIGNFMATVGNSNLVRIKRVG